MAEATCFVVDASSLSSPAKKPHYTEERLSSLPSRENKLEAATVARDRHLATRAASGKQAHAKIQQLQSQRSEEASLQRAKLVEDLEKKARNREELLEKRVQTCLDHDKHVAQVRQNAEVFEEEQRIAYAQRHLAKQRRYRKRRQSLSSRRSSSLDASWPPTQTAAVAIQRWYRLKQLKTVVDNFNSSRIGKLLHNAADVESFELVARALQDKDSLLVAKDLVRIFRRAVKKRVDDKATGKKKSGNEHRVLLTAIMVKHHPEAIFDQRGELEEALATMSDKMVAVLQQWAQAVMGSKRQMNEELMDLNHNVSLTWLQYVHTFKMWSQRDRSMLVQGMVDHHAELCRLRATVARKNNTPQADKWHPHIDEQLHDLESKLRKLGHSQEADACEEQRCTQLAEQQKLQQQLEERLRTVSEETGLSANDATDDESANDPESPSATEQLPAALRNMWDASLLHQLAVDPNFKLSTEETPDDDDEDSEAHMTLEQRIAQQTKRAVFDQMRHELSQPDNGLATVMAGVRQLLEDLQACTLPRQERLRKQLQDQFDVQLMAQQLEHGAFDLTSFVRLLQHHLSQLSAAIRDPEIAMLERHDNLVDMLQAALKLTAAVRLDLANFLLDQYRPLLRKHAVEAERQRLQDAIAAGAMTFDKTRAWLHQTPAEVASEQPHAPARGDNGKASYGTVYFAAVEKLLDERFSPEAWPETFEADKGTIKEASEGLISCIVVASMYTLITAAVPSLKTNARFAKVFANRSLVVLNGMSDKLAKVPDILYHLDAWVQAADHPALEPETITMVQTRVSTLAAGHPVYQLMTRRVQDELRRRFHDEAAQLKANTGLDVVAKALNKWTAIVARVAHHNKEVFVQTYDEILGST
eukprot:m.95971 g.95971  ORF g.95971 m.95971 type:complete len:872 (+) comp15037_c0_seq1:256-2871(+)